MTSHADEPLPPVQVVDPLRPQRNAMEIFLLLLAVLEFVQIVFLRPQPSAVEVLLGPVWAGVWATALLVGSSVVLVGLLWSGRSITALGLQKLGYLALGTMSLARAVALFGVDGPDRAGTVLAFGVAALLREWQIQNRIDRAQGVPTRLDKLAVAWRWGLEKLASMWQSARAWVGR